jgi:flagellar biosynthesis anti-sigma factor FlgM
MRIPGIERLFSIVNAKIRKAENSAQPQAKLTTPTDRVEISDRAQKVHAAHLETTDQAERAKYVAQIQAQVESGELEIDTDTIAQEMSKNGYFDDIAGG